MSFFAVLDVADFGGRTDFTVKRLHLNLWCLAAIGFHRRTFIFDVGVEIQAVDKPVGQITLAIPFETYTVESLTDKVLNSKTAALIFDTTIDSVTEHSIKYDGRDLEIANIATKKAERDKEYSQSGFTLWSLPLTEEIQPGRSAYIRLRFPVTATGRTWQWTRSHFQRTAATLDFRISDLRSSAEIAGGSELIKRVRPIEVVAAFVMAPAWLHGRTIHPEPSYIRLLEAKVWANYLNRAAEILNRSRLVVYYWKNQPKLSQPVAVTELAVATVPPILGASGSDSSPVAHSVQKSNREPVTPQNPMRVYCDLTIDGRPSRVFTAALSALLTVVVAAIVFELPFRGWSIGLVQWAGDLIQTNLGLITWAFISAIILYWIKWIKPIAAGYRWIVRAFQRLEATIFRTRPWLGPRE